MKQIIFNKEKLLKGIVRMNNASITTIVDNTMYYVSRKVFNTIIEEDVPTFVVEREHMGTKTNWIAIPMTL